MKCTFITLRRKPLLFFHVTHDTVKLEALACRINRRLKFLLCLEFCYPLAAPTMLADIGWFIHGSMDTGTQTYWTTMAIALKDWSLSDSTLWFENFLAGWRGTTLQPWGQQGRGLELQLTQGQTALTWWLPTTSAENSPPRGCSLKVTTCPKSHWCHQWASLSRSRCCLIYKRVCQAPTAVAEGPHVLLELPTHPGNIWSPKVLSFSLAKVPQAPSLAVSSSSLPTWSCPAGAAS